MTGKRVRPEDVQIGANIHQRLWLQKISQRQVADALEVEQSSVSRRLRGQQPFTAGELFVLAQLLEVDVARLVSLDPVAPFIETGERIATVKLPRLDSNQQPFANRLTLVRGGVVTRKRVRLERAPIGGGEAA